MTKSGEPTQYSISVPFLAVCIVLGIIATAEGIYLLNRPSTQGPSVAPVKKVTPTATPIPAPLFLQVDEPGSEAKSVQGEIRIAGKTNPYGIVAVYSNFEDLLVQGDAEGKFESTLRLDNNGGIFAVSAFSGMGEEKTEAFFAGDPGNPATDSALLKSTQKLGAEKLKEVLAGSDTKDIKSLPVKTAEEMELQKHAIVGVVGQVAQGQITLAAPVKGMGKIYFDSKTVASASRTAGSSDKISLAPGYFVIAIGTLATDGIRASRIHVIPVTPTAFQDQLPSFESGAGSSGPNGASLNGVLNAIPQGVLPTISLATPTPSPTPAPAL